MRCNYEASQESSYSSSHYKIGLTNVLDADLGGKAFLLTSNLLYCCLTNKLSQSIVLFNCHQQVGYIWLFVYIVAIGPEPTDCVFHCWLWSVTQCDQWDWSI